MEQGKKKSLLGYAKLRKSNKSINKSNLKQLQLSVLEQNGSKGISIYDELLSDQNDQNSYIKQLINQSHSKQKNRCHNRCSSQNIFFSASEGFKKLIKKNKAEMNDSYTTANSIVKTDFPAQILNLTNVSQDLWCNSNDENKVYTQIIVNNSYLNYQGKTKQQQEETFIDYMSSYIQKLENNKNQKQQKKQDMKKKSKIQKHNQNFNETVQIYESNMIAMRDKFELEIETIKNKYKKAIRRIDDSQNYILKIQNQLKQEQRENKKLKNFLKKLLDRFQNLPSQAKQLNKYGNTNSVNHFKHFY